VSARVLTLLLGLVSSGHALYQYFANDDASRVVGSLVVCSIIAVADVVFKD
jgi:hypothetical protein